VQYRLTLVTAILVALVTITAWELYWRSQGKLPDIDDEKGLWAMQRAKVEDLGEDGVVLIGSSRVLFDIQLDEWEAATGVKPVMLASPGTTPLPLFTDIVKNTQFKGTVILGVAPGLFFSSASPETFFWKRGQQKVDHYRDRTYAQRLNLWLSIPLQSNFAFISVSEEEWDDDIDLRTLLRNIDWGRRSKEPEMPPFYRFSEARIDRNVRMLERLEYDTTFSKTVQEAWRAFTARAREPDKVGTISYFNEDAKAFKARGGNLILVRCPSTDYIRDLEREKLPRESFWDTLVASGPHTAYHFEDYDELSGFDCPEWSHLSGPDADIFTRRLAEIMIADGVIKNHKTD
jgi:hypothetical protein